jgi:hypothetical protein
VLFGRLFLGNGRFKPELRSELEMEGIVLIEEGVSGSIRYTDFKAPGRFHDGKITPLRMAIAVTEQRFAIYSHSGRGRLVDSGFDTDNIRALELTVEDMDRLIVSLDYANLDVANVSGQVAIHAKTPEASAIADQVRARTR